ncbi:hypothetical protein FKM82_000341 [Ascaphus truei]
MPCSKKPPLCECEITQQWQSPPRRSSSPGPSPCRSIDPDEVEALHMITPRGSSSCFLIWLVCRNKVFSKALCLQPILNCSARSTTSLSTTYPWNRGTQWSRIILSFPAGEADQETELELIKAAIVLIFGLLVLCGQQLTTA